MTSKYRIMLMYKNFLKKNKYKNNQLYKHKIHETLNLI
jgi:hypothetical protein